MEQAEIALCLKARVACVTPQGVSLQDGRLLRGATVVCTIGNTTPAVIEHLDVPMERGRLLTQADMRLIDFANAWAIGDCAHIVNAYNHEPSPATGQFAERQGRQAAENIVRVVHGRPTRPFTFRPLGQLCAIGGHQAVAEGLGLRLSGCLAWVLWRGVYLLKLPSWSRRAKVGFDWAWELLFARDLAHPRAQPTERVSQAYYQPGEYIFRQGEPAMNFYAIERARSKSGTHRTGRRRPPSCTFSVREIFLGRWRSLMISRVVPASARVQPWKSWSWDDTSLRTSRVPWRPFVPCSSKSSKNAAAASGSSCP
jgi:NADH:ubiquinone reductase (H+-translocating)